MDINVMKTFVAVCEYSGFSAAAEKLGYTQSTVSSQIKQMEKELNTTLFDRFYHRISLTPEGTTVLQHIREILESHERMMNALTGAEMAESEIRLAMSSSICSKYFLDDFVRFRREYPNIRLIITECGTEAMADMLRKNEVDLVFTLDSHIYESDFIICAERKEEVQFVAAPTHPLCGRKTLTLKEIHSEEFVLTENDMSYRQILNHNMAARSLELNPVLEIGNPVQICEIVKKSGLISFLPDFTTEEYVKKGELCILPITDCHASVWTQLLIHKNKWRSPALHSFIEYYRNIIENTVDNR